MLTCLAGNDVKVLHTARDEGEVLQLFKCPVPRNQDLDKNTLLLLTVCVEGRGRERGRGGEGEEGEGEGGISLK